MTLVTAQAAETFAARAFEWIATDTDRVARFLAVTGADVGMLRHQAGDPVFLASVVDFLLADEMTLVTCCTALGEPFEMPMHARAALPGGDQHHWT